MRTLLAGASYFGIVFAAGWVLGPVRVLLVVPHLGALAGLALELPVMVAAMVLAGRWVLRRFGIADALPARLGVGLVALALLIPAELAGSLWLRGIALSDYLAGFATTPGLASLAAFLLFAAMPAIIGARRRRRVD